MPTLILSLEQSEEYLEQWMDKYVKYLPFDGQRELLVLRDLLFEYSPTGKAIRFER